MPEEGNPPGRAARERSSMTGLIDQHDGRALLLLSNDAQWAESAQSEAAGLGI